MMPKICQNLGLGDFMRNNVFERMVEYNLKPGQYHLLTRHK